MPDDIVVVMTDDHAQWCCEPYGNNEVATPTLEYLAETGVQMDEAFCPTPVCSPSRASFFTGRLASQHGIHDWIEIGSDHDGAHWLDGERTLPELLGDAGYETALTGKWHCGRGADDRVFDRTANMHADDWDVPKFSLERDRRIVDCAIDLLQEDRERPLFLFVGLTATHSPWRDEPERLVERYRGSTFPDVPADATYRYGRRTVDWLGDEDEARAQYYAAVQGLDEQVGRLVDELTRQERLGETLVIYTADHGLNCGHHGIWGKGNGTNPQNVLEESIRVPLLVAGHDSLQRGQRRSEFVDHCDTFQTLLAFAGVEPPDDRDYPGESYLPQLTSGAGSPEWEQRQVCEYGDVRAIRTERHKLVARHPDGPTLLFDLETDPRETRSVADEPAYADVRDRLQDRLEATFDRYTEPGTAGVPLEELPKYNLSEAWDR